MLILFSDVANAGRIPAQVSGAYERSVGNTVWRCLPVAFFIAEHPLFSVPQGWGFQVYERNSERQPPAWSHGGV
jgi:hypothetical protein